MQAKDTIEFCGLHMNQHAELSDKVTQIENQLTNVVGEQARCNNELSYVAKSVQHRRTKTCKLNSGLSSLFKNPVTHTGSNDQSEISSIFLETRNPTPNKIKDQDEQQLLFTINDQK